MSDAYLSININVCGLSMKKTLCPDLLFLAMPTVNSVAGIYELELVDRPFSNVICDVSQQL